MGPCDPWFSSYVSYGGKRLPSLGLWVDINGCSGPLETSYLTDKDEVDISPPLHPRMSSFSLQSDRVLSLSLQNWIQGLSSCLLLAGSLVWDRGASALLHPVLGDCMRRWGGTKGPHIPAPKISYVLVYEDCSCLTTLPFPNNSEPSLHESLMFPFICTTLHSYSSGWINLLYQDGPSLPPLGWFSKLSSSNKHWEVWWSNRTWHEPSVSPLG